MSLRNGADVNNIFIVSGPMNLTNSIVWGTFIAKNNFSISTTAQPNLNYYARLYSNVQNIIFSTPGPAQPSLSIYVNTNTPVCYLKGTLILTPTCFKPIEELKEGDEIISNGEIFYGKHFQTPTIKHYKTLNVKWVDGFTIKQNSLTKSSLPICIKKDAIYKNYPFQDLFVSPCHGIIIDNIMHTAASLINNDTIYQVDIKDVKEDVEYYHIELDTHRSIIANGVFSETFLNFDYKYLFFNKKCNNIKLNNKYEHEYKNEHEYEHEYENKLSNPLNNLITNEIEIISE